MNPIPERPCHAYKYCPMSLSLCQYQEAQVLADAWLMASLQEVLSEQASYPNT